MHKKILLGSLLTAMIFGVNSVSAAEVKVTNEETLKSCVSVANNVCKLESDITLPSTMIISENVTIDLNGNKITGEIGNNKSLIEVSSITLTINDTKGTGLIENTKAYGIYALNDGKVILNNGTIRSLYSPLTGNNTTGDMNFIINGGTLEAIQGPALYMSGQTVLEINGGTLIGGLNLRMGQVTINGGTIINNNPLNTDSVNDYYGVNGMLWLSDAIGIVGGTYTSKNATYKNSLSLTINGGTIESTVGNGITVYALGKVQQDINITINGGTINGKNIAFTVENPQSLDLKDNSYGKVADYTKVNNVPTVKIVKGKFNSDVAKYIDTTSKIEEANGVFTVSENKTISSTVDGSKVEVTFESETLLPNGYTLSVKEQEIKNIDTVKSDVKKMINNAISNDKKEIKSFDILATYDISVLDENLEIVPMKSGKYKVSLKLGSDILSKYKNYKVIYINEKGEVEELLNSSVNGDVITFETTHLSTYSVVGYDVANLSAVVNPNTGDDIALYIVLLTASLVGICAFVIKKRTI